MQNQNTEGTLITSPMKCQHQVWEKRK